MDINPLSLLEVTMDSEAVEEDDDDECVIIEEPTETHVLDDTPEPPPISEAETEMLVDAGIHFLQQADSDPLSIPQNDTGSTQRKSMPILWVTTNLNNLATVTFAEHDYRKSAYKDVQDVLKERLHCTICLDHVGCDIRIHPSAIEHPVLKVLTCEKCTLGYKAVQFSLNEYGRENRCRWCAKLPREKGPLLRYCQQCPFSFCELCLYHNFPNLQPRHKPWTCFVCNLKQLWPARCTLWALQTLKARFISRPRPANMPVDISHCAQRCQKVRPMQNEAARPVRPPQPQPKGISNLKKVRTPAQKGAVKRPLNGQTQWNVPQNPPKQNFTPPPSSFQTPSPIVPVKPSDTLKTDWFCTKINNYERDINIFLNKLRKVRDDSRPEESMVSVNTKIETVTTLLSLASNLLKDCSLNLMNDWKEKKARFAMENLQVEVTSNSPSPQMYYPVKNQINNQVHNQINNQINNRIHNQIQNQINKQSLTPGLNNYPRPKAKTSKKKPPPRNNCRKIVLKKEQNGLYSFKNTKRSPPQKHVNYDQLMRQLGINECFVKVSRLSNKILDELFETGCYKTKKSVGQSLEPPTSIPSVLTAKSVPHSDASHRMPDSSALEESVNLEAPDSSVHNLSVSNELPGESVQSSNEKQQTQDNEEPVVTPSIELTD